jgi:very-short-patch-repair endonuclease
MSKAEEIFLMQCRALKLAPDREYRFDPARRWRFDFAFVGQKIAIEVEGGVWNGGRHTRGAGFIADCEKYNAAAESGWMVLRYAVDQIKSGDAINQVERIIRGIK